MRILDFPLVLFLTLFVGLWLSTRAGAIFGKWLPLPENSREDYTIVLTATLTLLGLIIGFTFSMAVSRYDQRKDYEEKETNAIGTEYLRVGLLGSPDALKVQSLLRKYVDHRVLWYTTRDSHQLSQINANTASLQHEMWLMVENTAAARPLATTALVASGMNEVLDSQGRTQAAWLNRIPPEAWMLMTFIALCSNLLFGYGLRKIAKGLLVVLPLVLSTAFFLIADIDSPLGGVIRVVPQNLMELSESLHAHN